MPSNFDRRTFLAASAGAALCGSEAWGKSAGLTNRCGLVDFHTHLVGIGDSDSGIFLGSRARSNRFLKPLILRTRLRYLHRYGRRAATVDEAFRGMLVDSIRCSGMDKAMVIAMDAHYDSCGNIDWKYTSSYVPNDYLFRVTSRYPDLMVPCVGLNPARPDAMEELAKSAEKGARGLKIYPPYQNVDLSDRKYTSFFQRCADLKMIVMVHTGYSETNQMFGIETGDPRRLSLALEQGCTVVAQHSAISGPKRPRSFLPEFQAMLRKYPNLYGDTAAMTVRTRSDGFLKLLRDEFAKTRLLFATDWPVFPRPSLFKQQIGWRNAWRIGRIKNDIAKDFALQQQLGLGRSAAQRGYQLLFGDGINV